MKEECRKAMATAAGVHALRDEYARTIVPARALAAEALTRCPMRIAECRVQNTCGGYGLTPEEIALMWQTAPPRMPITRNPVVPRDPLI